MTDFSVQVIENIVLLGMRLGIKFCKAKAGSRHKIRREIIYECDACGIVYCGKYQKKYLNDRKFTCCSYACSAKLRKKGGGLHKVTQANRDNVAWQQKLQKTVRDRYGVENASQLKSVKNKKEETCLKNYGVRNGLQLRDRVKAGMLEKYGVENPAQSEKIISKIEATNLERYGVRNVSQAPSIITKILQNQHGAHSTGHMLVKGKRIFYRSSYERRFLEWCSKSDDISDIVANVPIWYIGEDKKRHRYFADFGVVFIDKKATLVEVKASKCLELGDNQQKFAAAQAQLKELGYDRFLIVTEDDLKKMGV